MGRLEDENELALVCLMSMEIFFGIDKQFVTLVCDHDNLILW